MQIITGSFVKEHLPYQSPEHHKGLGGTALLLCGSEGYAGAAALAAEGCYRMGAGIVRGILPAEIYPIVSARVPEAVFTLTEPDTAGLTFCRQTKSAGLVGCGLGNTAETKSAVEEILAAETVPLVLDADGLNVLAGRIEYLGKYQGDLVITPHPGEAARLLGIPVTEVQENRERVVLRLAEKGNCVAVLKGHGTLVADPNGRVVRCDGGNAGMGKGGSGDVLAGMTASLLAQGVPAFESAVTAVYLHAAAGDRAAEKLSKRGMLARDLLTYLPEVLAEFE